MFIFIPRLSCVDIMPSRGPSPAPAKVPASDFSPSCLSAPHCSSCSATSASITSCLPTLALIVFVAHCMTTPPRVTPSMSISLDIYLSLQPSNPSPFTRTTDSQTNLSFFACTLVFPLPLINIPTSCGRCWDSAWSPCAMSATLAWRNSASIRTPWVRRSVSSYPVLILFACASPPSPSIFSLSLA